MSVLLSIFAFTSLFLCLIRLQLLLRPIVKSVVSDVVSSLSLSYIRRQMVQHTYYSF